MRRVYEALLTELRNYRVETDADGEHRLYLLGVTDPLGIETEWLIQTLDENATLKDILQAVLERMEEDDR